MKILIVSDTHKKNENYFKVLEMHHPDMVIHCGDAEGSEYALSAAAKCPVYIVLGNNDFFSDLPREITLDIGVIDLRIPGTYIVTVILFAGFFGGHGFDPAYLSAQLAGGGLILGAFFMATDYVTRPITIKGQYVYGVVLGLLTGIFRIFGPGAEGVSYAIILGNLLVPLIEKFTMPVAFGRKAGAKHEK